MQILGQFWVQINSINSPNPENWQAYGHHTFDLNSMSNQERSKLIKERNINIHTVRWLMSQKQGLVTEEADVSFNHDGDEFLWIEIDGQITAVRWKYVESYQITWSNA